MKGKNLMEVYACYNKNIEIRELSSSGGIFALIAQLVIDDGGVVFAVCYDENFETEHRKITSMEMLLPSLGSKYVPSRLSDTFESVRKHLMANQRVLFVGTPCQCAGLKQFLGQEYEKLWLIDLICHGVPSKVAWRKYLEGVSGTQLEAINMRDKSLGWSDWKYDWILQYRDGNKKIIPQNQISFMQGFVKDFYLRPSCYECHFKGMDRITDITIGDYWGVWKEQPEMDDNKGTSIVMIHSEKGKMMLEYIKKYIRVSKTEIEKVLRYNPSIIESAKITDKRKLFFEKMKTEETFENIMQELTNHGKRRNVIMKIKNILLNCVCLF